MERYAARLGDAHDCPRCGEGALEADGCRTVLLGNEVAARRGDRATCCGGQTAVKEGAASVFIGGRPAARQGDATEGGGRVARGLETVHIGGEGAAENGAPATLETRPGERPYQALSRFAEERGFHVTSTTGGPHNRGSAHGEGRAIDVRTFDKSDAQITTFIAEAQRAGIRVRDERTRPPGQAVWTGPHLHLSVPPGP